jgi:hypothetical protein
MSSSQVCRRCRASFPLESFPKSINGTRTLKTCGTCSREEGDVRRQKIKKIPTTDSTESHCQRGPGHRVDQKKVSCDDLVAELQSRCRFLPAFTSAIKQSFDEIFADISPEGAHFHIKHVQGVVKLFRPIMQLANGLREIKRRRTMRYTWTNVPPGTFYA